MARTDAATLTPFRALSFDPAHVGDLGAVWAPPYDVILGRAAVELRNRHPNNIVRLTNPQGPESERYDAAAGTLAEWMASGVLRQEREPAIYVHRHEYEFAGMTRARAGVWALLQLTRFEAGVVLPHERTMSGPKADRLALMRACRAHLSPVFMICSDPGAEISELLAECAAGAPDESAEFPVGERHAIWRLSAGSVTGRLAELMSDQSLLIADGHHRYETALAYQDERPGGGGHDHVLVYVVPEGDAGLLLLPTHRIVTGAGFDPRPALERSARRFEVRELSEAEISAADELLERERGRPSFIFVTGDGAGWLLRMRSRVASVSEAARAASDFASVAFHDVFLAESLDITPELQSDRVTYARDPGEAMERVRTSGAAAAALLAPAEVAQVREAAAAGVRLPAKTTYFWPKVPTGVAVHIMDG